MVSKKGHVPWNKGLTKETDSRILALSHPGRPSWNKGKVGVCSPHTLSLMSENAKKRVGSSNPNWKGGKRTKKCLYCGNEFHVDPNEFNGAKYCSISCRIIGLGEQHRGQGNPNWKGGSITMFCECCGHEFTLNRHRLGSRHYCSVSCASKMGKVFATLNKDPEFQRKRRAMGKPNKAERKLESILEKNFPGQWKFVGNGDFILGSLNPDFVNINGKKEIIELFGCWYHGCPTHHPERKVGFQYTEYGKSTIYARYGFKTLVLWEHDLNNESEDYVKNKVCSLMENQ